LTEKSDPTLKAFANPGLANAFSVEFSFCFVCPRVVASSNRWAEICQRLWRYLNLNQYLIPTVMQVEDLLCRDRRRLACMAAKKAT
jgi:hypothetical protein